jgi:precorrin-6Y C5,15-methyltransferase (decarboxylating)
MIPVEVVGMGISPDDLTDSLRALIQRADILVGAERHLADFPKVPARKQSLQRGLKPLIADIRRWMQTRKVVVLASGDPLFFGIGSFLIQALEAENVVIHPNVSSVAAAFARLKIPWHNAVILSLHGRRDYRRFLDAVRQREPVAVLTDPNNHPGRLARLCLENNIGDLQMCVLEQLGTQQERHRWTELTRAVRMRFREPNLAVFRRTPKSDRTPQTLHLGMAEQNFDHEHNVITKSEVRAVVLSKLQLADRHVLWDLGAGSGSIAVEAALFIRTGSIVAVEKDSRRVDQIRSNGQRFGVKNVQIVQADLPDGLSALPRPDRIFIGGGGRKIRKIIREAAGFLKPRGVLVVNTVLLSSLEAANRELGKLGFDPDVVQVQINRGRAMPWGSRLAAENPVWIISGRRPATKSAGARPRGKKR